MKGKIITVRKHFQRIKYVGSDKYWNPKIVKCHLRDKVPVGNKVYIEKDKRGFVKVLVDLTMMYGDMKIPEIKKAFKPYEPYKSYDLGERV